MNQADLVRSMYLLKGSSTPPHFKQSWFFNFAGFRAQEKKVCITL